MQTAESATALPDGRTEPTVDGLPHGERAGAFRLTLLGDRSTTALVAAGVFGLGLDGGAFALGIRNALAVGVWWTIAVGVATAVLPLARPTRAAAISAGLLAAFAAVTLASAAWADSAERVFTEFNRVTLYLGIFALAVVAARRGAARRWIDGLAIGITGVGLLALASRLFPGLHLRDDLSHYYFGSGFLSYPLNYWNGLAIFVGLAFPLLLVTAVSTGGWVRRGLAVAPMPALIGTIYLTSSRGGTLVAAIGALMFIWLSRRRFHAILATACAGGGGALAVLVLHARPGVVNGAANGAAAAQGRTATVLLVLICAATAVAYGLGSRLSLSRPRWLDGRARWAVAAVVVAAIGAGVVAAHPSQRLHDFKQTPVNPFAAAEVRDSAGLANTRDTPGAAVGSHLVSSAGNGRWQMWGAAVDEFESRPLIGRGAGSYEAWWAQHGSISYFTRHAHSLYLQTLGELGLLGLVVLLAFGASLAPPVVRRLRASSPEHRVLLAALVAVLVAYAFGAGIDWMWELTVVSLVGVIAAGLLTGPATSFAGAQPELPAARPAANRRRWRPVATRGAIALASVAVAAAATLPLLVDRRVGDSQTALARGDTTAALRDADDARALMPWTAGPYLQLALVRERSGALGRARVAIRHAIANDPTDWRLWLVKARIESEANAIPAARASLGRAKALNPRSPLFRSGGSSSSAT